MPCCRRFISSIPSCPNTAAACTHSTQQTRPLTQEYHPARSKQAFSKAAASAWPRRTVTRTSQARHDARTPLKAVFNAPKIKNPQGLRQTLRIAPASSSSPVPQPSRERWSTLRGGLLAHGSPYFPRLPISHVKRRSSSVKRLNEHSYEIRFTRYVSRSDSGRRGFRPHLQRRDREGISPSSLTQESQCRGHNRRERQNLSSSHCLSACHSSSSCGSMRPLLSN